MLDPQEYVFVHGATSPLEVQPLMRFREREGETLVVTRVEAAQLGLTVAFACRRIVLEVDSALDAVGLLAAVTVSLAADNIAVNTVSAIHHDHLFVANDDADKAMRTLEALSASTGKLG